GRDDERRARGDRRDGARQGRRDRRRRRDPRRGDAAFRLRSDARLGDGHPRRARVRGTGRPVTCPAMPSRSRDRQLAKLAARRKAEQSASQRRRRLTAGIVGGLIGLAAIAVALAIVFGGNDTPAASGSPSAPQTSSPSASSGGLPTKTGTVTPQGTPPNKVACGASRPASADAPKPQFDAAPTPDQVLKANTIYNAVMETSCGTIRVQLDTKDAPQTVASFVFLADKGYFDGQFFHRVVDSIDVI